MLNLHSDEYKSTIQLHVEVKGYAQCPEFLEFLQEVIDPEDIPILQEYFGYCMTKWTSCERCLILYGAPRSGKSTILRVLDEILGDENTTHITLQNLEDRFKTAQLEGKLLNVFFDLPSKPLDDDGILKTLISGEPIVVENKGKTPYTMHPHAKMMFSTNQIPRIKDHAGSLARRLIIIPFKTSVPIDKVDINLKDKLLKEKSGIFIWAMDGLRRLIENNYQFSESKSGKEALDKYVIESDNVLAFISECVRLEPDGYYYCRDLYDDYRLWCGKSGYGKAYVALPRFNDTIIRKFGNSIRKTEHSKTRRAIWQGLSCQLPVFPTLDERVLESTISDDDLTDW